MNCCEYCVSIVFLTASIHVLNPYSSGHLPCTSLSQWNPQPRHVAASSASTRSADRVSGHCADGHSAATVSNDAASTRYAGAVARNPARMRGHPWNAGRPATPRSDGKGASTRTAPTPVNSAVAHMSSPAGPARPAYTKDHAVGPPRSTMPMRAAERLEKPCQQAGAKLFCP